MSLETVTDPKIRAQGWVLCSEAARKTGRAVQTLYRWIDDGKVAGTSDGYRRYIHWNAMIDHLGPAFCKAKGLRRLPAAG